MGNLEFVKHELRSGAYNPNLKRLYNTDSEVSRQIERYAQLCDLFIKEYQYGEKDVSFFSAPGRTEVCGNHTDHNNGKVLAAGINLDAVAAVCKAEGTVTRVKSVGYDMDTVDFSDTQVHTDCFGTSQEIIRGMYAGFLERGYKVGAFDACTTSSVLSGSGLSSSAAFEVLIGTILNYLYNDGAVSPVEIAQIAQFAENKYFGKPCGLMDQTACSVGGFVKIDFADTAHPVIEKIDFDFNACGHALCIVNTGGSHADLTNEYGAVRAEMESVAALFGKKVLREVGVDEFLSSIKEIREKTGDRAILRAIHFFEENYRVEKEAEALKTNNFDAFKENVIDSGRSSYMYNQNVYPSFDVQNQSLSVALSVAELILKDKGAWRVHGGGFAGTMQAFVPNEHVDTYLEEMRKIFGEDACYVLSVRAVGGTQVI